MSMRRIIDIVESESEKSDDREDWKIQGFKSNEAYKMWLYLSSPKMEFIVDDAIRWSKDKTGGIVGSSGRRVRGNYDYTAPERIMIHFGAAKGEGPKSGESSLRKTDEKLPDGTRITWAAVKEAMALIAAEYRDRAQRARFDAKMRKRYGY